MDGQPIRFFAFTAVDAHGRGWIIYAEELNGARSAHFDPLEFLLQ